MATQISLSITEIVLLVFFAIILGITIHFFLTSRKSLKTKLGDTKKGSTDFNEWKLKYFNDIELRDKEITELKKQLAESEENRDIYSIEAEEMRKQNKKLMADIESARKAAPQAQQGEKQDYFEKLKQAQSSLLEHNEKINQLLSNIDIIKETEEKQKEILRDNEELYVQIDELRAILKQKELEIGNISQKAHLSREMTSRLDNAYADFNALQEKIQKLESQVSSSRMLNIEYEDLKEEHIKIRRDFDEQKVKLNALTNENRELRSQMDENGEKLREANFQRQQLQKRVSYLEELNNDLQAVSDANKRLENQIKRIGELESMLNVVSQERDQLAKKSV